MKTYTLKEIKELCEKATKGEWYWASGKLYSKTLFGDVHIDNLLGFFGDGDKKFIAASREIIPQLVKWIEEVKQVFEGVDWHLSEVMHIAPNVEKLLKELGME